MRALKYHHLKDGILYRTRKHPELGEIQLLCIPKNVISECFEGVSKTTTVGHPGLSKMYSTLLNYYVPSMKQTLGDYLTRCNECQKYKTFPNKKRGEFLHRLVGNICE